jgi:hypothetical protein
MRVSINPSRLIHIALITIFFSSVTCGSRDQAEMQDSESAIQAEVSEYLESFPKGSGEISMSRQQAIAFLLRTNVFADSAIGISGVTSNQVAAFRILLREPDADTLFKQLLQEGQIAGQLYGLCGLYWTDRSEMMKAVPRYAKIHSEVRTQSGCSGSSEAVSELVENKERCTLRLSDGESPSQWCKTHSCESYRVDIVGGAYPWEFSGKDW